MENFVRVVILSGHLSILLLPYQALSQDENLWTYYEGGRLDYGYCSPPPTDGYQAETCSSYYLACSDANYWQVVVNVSDVLDDSERRGPDGRAIIYDFLNGDHHGEEGYAGVFLVQPQSLQATVPFDQVELSAAGGDTPQQILITSSTLDPLSSILSIPNTESLDLRIGSTNIQIYSKPDEREVIMKFLDDCSKYVAEQ